MSEVCDVVHFAAKVLKFGSPDPATFPAEPVQPNPTLKCAFALDADAHYYWRVRGLDLPTGVNGVFSAPADFFYRPASSPVLTGPPDGASTAAPVLSWQRLPGYSRYRVTTVRTSGGILGLTSLGRPGLAPATADRRHFTLTAAGTGSGVSLDPIAADNGAAQLVSPSMTWQPRSGASYYRVFSGVQNSGTFGRLSGTTKLYQPAFTYAASALPAGDYAWYVEAYDVNNALVDTSAVGSFTVADPTFAQYLSPADCTVPDCATEPRTPELRWQPVDGAGSYRVWAALDKDFTNIVRGYTTEQTTLTPRESYRDNAAGQSYFWFVQLCRSLEVCGPFQGPSLVEHAQAFRKKSAPVVPTGPADQANEGDTVTLTWQDYRSSAPDAVGARQYHVQVATDPLFANLVDDATVDQTSYQAWTKSYPDGVYFWRVQAVDGGGLNLTNSTEALDDGRTVRQFRKSASVPAPGSTEAGTGLPRLGWPAMPQGATPISFHSSAPAHRRSMYSRSGLADRTHTLTVRATGTKVVAATGTYVELDAFVAGGVAYQENSAAVRSAFLQVAHPGASGGSYATLAQEPDTTGAEYRFGFRGTGFTWLATKAPNGGSASVYIDNVYRGTANQFARVTTAGAAVYNSPPLAAGMHQVRLVATGVVPAGSTGSHVSVDAITTR